MTREQEAAALKVLLRIVGGRARETSDLSDDIVAISGHEHKRTRVTSDLAA